MNYALVRGAARFAPVRRVAVAAHALRYGRSDVSAGAEPYVERLRRDGLAEGLVLSAGVVAAIREYTAGATVFADRDPMLGFAPGDEERAGQLLGKPVLVAQYFNTRRECPAIDAIADDPLLTAIAAGALGSAPTMVGVSLWWTYPVDALETDRDRHAHLFHRDVDDFAFVKFFYYLTDVEPGDGGHVCVTGSHLRPPHLVPSDRWRLRRFSDDEIVGYYGDAVREITGPAGTGFAENTLCVHKGLTPTKTPRLLLQFEFALRDHGVMHDRRDQLGSIA